MSSAEQLVPLLRIEDLATYLCVPRKTIYQWRLRGEGPPAIKVGGKLRYRHHDVERWLEERKALSLSEPGGVAAVADVSARGGVASAAPSPISVQAPSAPLREGTPDGSAYQP